MRYLAIIALSFAPLWASAGPGAPRPPALTATVTSEDSGRNSVKPVVTASMDNRQIAVGYRPGRYRTDLVVDGAPKAVVIVPEGPAWRALGETIVAGIREKSGTSLPLVTSSEAARGHCQGLKDEFKKMNRIAIGNINVNEAMVPLYARYLTWEDGAYPGPGGYAIHIVRDPYGERTNDLILGASDLKGATAAVTAFLASDKLTTLPNAAHIMGIMDVKPVFAEETRKAIETVRRGVNQYLAVAKQNPTKPSPPVGEFSPHNVAAAWALTGDKSFAEALTFYGRFLADSPTPVIPDGHYGWEIPYPTYIVIADGNLVDDETVREIDAKVLSELWACRGDYGIRRGARAAGSRHQMAASSAYLLYTDYLSRRLGDDTDGFARSFLTKEAEGVSAFFRHLGKTAITGDEDGGVSATNCVSILQSLLVIGDTSCFQSGLAREASLKMVSIVDNFGWGVGLDTYEDAYMEGATENGANNGGPLAIAAFYYQDPELKWVKDNLVGMGFYDWFGRVRFGLRQYATSPESRPIPPTGGIVTGAVMASPGALWGYKPTSDFPAGKVFDKAVFRSGFFPDSSFVCFQGVSPVSEHNATDRMALIRYACRGQLWLVANSQSREQTARSGFIVGGPGKDEMNRFPRLNHIAKADGIDFFSATISGVRDGQWTRWAVNLKNGLLFVADTFTAGKPGQYDLVGSYKCVVPTRLRPDGFEALKAGWRTRIVPAGFPALSLDNGLTRMDAQRCYYARVADAAALKANESATVAVALSTREIESADDTRLTRLAPRIFLLESNGERFIVGSGPIARDGFATDAALFALTATKGVFVGGAKLKTAAAEFVLNAKPGENTILNGDFLAAFAAVIPEKTPIQTPVAAGFKTIREISLDSDVLEDAPVTGYTLTPKPLDAGWKLDNNVVPMWNMGATLDVSKPARFDFHREVEAATVAFVTETLQNHVPPPDVPPKTISVRAGKTIAGLESAPWREVDAAYWGDARELYKMDVWRVDRYRAALPPGKFRYVEIAGLPKYLMELGFYAPSSGAAGARQIQTFSPGGAQSDLFVLATSPRAIVGLSPDGERRFTIKTPYDIIAFIVGTLRSDEPPRVYVICYDLKIRAYDLGGKLVAESGPLPQHPYTINIAKGNKAFPSRLLITFYYNVQAFDAELKPVSPFAPLPGMWMENAATVDINGDGVDDLVAADIYARSYCVDGKTLSYSPLFWSTGGIFNGIWTWGEIANGKRPVLFAGPTCAFALLLGLDKEKPKALWAYIDGSEYAAATPFTKGLIMARRAGGAIALNREGSPTVDLRAPGYGYGIAHVGDQPIFASSVGLWAFAPNGDVLAFDPGATYGVAALNRRILSVKGSKIAIMELKDEK